MIEVRRGVGCGELVGRGKEVVSAQWNNLVHFRVARTSNFELRGGFKASTFKQWERHSSPVLWHVEHMCDSLEQLHCGAHRQAGGRQADRQVGGIG